MGALTYPTHNHMGNPLSLGGQQHFAKALVERSPTGAAQLESLKGAMWLLSVGQIRGALVLLTQVLEAGYKGFLRALDTSLVLPTFSSNGRGSILPMAEKEDRLRAARALFQKQGPCAAHRRARASFDWNKTCVLLEAFDRAARVAHLRRPLKPAKTSELRNDVVHEGGREADALSCLRAILDETLPALADFYHRAYDLPLEKGLTPGAARELDVARTYLRVTDNPNPRRALNSLHPYQKVWFQFYQPSGFQPVERAVVVDDGSRYDEVAEKVRVLERRYRGIDFLEPLDFELDCICCGSLEVRVALNTRDPFPRHDAETGAPYFTVTHVLCPECDLTLDPDDGELAGVHFGPITQERVGEKGWAQLLKDYDVNELGG